MVFKQMTHAPRLAPPAPTFFIPTPPPTFARHALCVSVCVAFSAMGAPAALANTATAQINSSDVLRRPTATQPAHAKPTANTPTNTVFANHLHAPLSSHTGNQVKRRQPAVPSAAQPHAQMQVQPQVQTQADNSATTATHTANATTKDSQAVRRRPSIAPKPNPDTYATNTVATAGTSSSSPSSPSSQTQDNQITRHRHTSSQDSNLAKLDALYTPDPNSCYGLWHYPTRSIAMPNDGTLYASANHGYYNNADYAELSGNVSIAQNGQEVQAQHLSLNPTTGQARADGQVLFVSRDSNATKNTTDNANNPRYQTGDVDLIGLAKQLDYNTQSTQAVAQDVAFASNQLHAHGHASTLDHNAHGRYTLNQVMFSTCAPHARRWHLDADNIQLDTITGRGISKNATLRIKNVPVLYLPYFNFPIDDRRASGFLLPNLGLDGNDALALSTPYYLNLAPNYDATITPTLYTNKNPRLSGEFRYLTHRFGGGRVDGAYLPRDKTYDDKHRHHLFYDHAWQVTDKDSPLGSLGLFANYRYVSDSDYLSDFNSLGIENNALNLPRRIGATYQNSWLNAELRAERFQTLDGTDSFGNAITDKDRPYARLPQLAAHYRLPSENWGAGMGQLNITGVHNSAYFKKTISDGSDSEKSGARVYNQLSITRPIARPWGYLHPKLSLSHLYMSYDEDSRAGQNLSKNEGRYSATVPSISLDAGLHLKKQGAPFGFSQQLGGYQLLSPRLKYLYAPYQDQSAMPNFDTSMASMRYQQLFADSWFLGYDRLSDLHAITPALHYHYIDHAGRTRVDAGIGEQFYLSDARVHLGDTNIFANRSSGLAWQLSLQPWQNLWLDTEGSFTHNYELNAIVASMRYQPKPNALFNLGVIERKHNPSLGQLPLSAYTASAVFPINQRWQLVTGAQYNRSQNLLMDVLMGVNYEDCCIGLSIYGRHYRNDLRADQAPKRAIMAEVRLHGLTGSGSGRLNRLLSEKIQGFDNVTQTPQGNHTP